jgi:hypothetical protein
MENGDFNEAKPKRVKNLKLKFTKMPEKSSPFEPRVTIYASEFAQRELRMCSTERNVHAHR